MNALLIFIQMSLIKTKIIHIYGNHQCLKAPTILNENARHKFGKEVWRCILQRAVMRMTEQENFLSTIQEVYDFEIVDELYLTHYVNHINDAMDAFLIAELNFDAHYLLKTKKKFMDRNQSLMVFVSIPFQHGKYIFTKEIISEWHTTEPVDEIVPFRRLLLCEEILYQKILLSKDLKNGIRKDIMTEGEIELYAKLEKYHQNDYEALWEVYKTDTVVYSFRIDFLDIMLNNKEAKKVIGYLQKNLKFRDTIVCTYEEHAILRTIKYHTPGDEEVDGLDRIYERNLDYAINLTSEHRIVTNINKLGNQLKKLKKKKSLLYIHNRCNDTDHIGMTHSYVIGNIGEQEKWNKINAKLTTLLGIVFDKRSKNA